MLLLLAAAETRPPGGGGDISDEPQEISFKKSNKNKS
jgi:hypothetical protein